MQLSRYGKMLTASKEKSAGETMTFRIDKDILDILRQESELKQLSLNTLANQIFRQHTKWGITAVEAGFMPVRRKLLVKLMGKLPDAYIVAVAKFIAETETRKAILLLGKEYNISSVLDFLEYWLRTSGFIFRREISGKAIVFMIQHNMSRKWSLYLAQLIRFTLKDLAVKKTESEIAHDSLVFRIYNK